MKNLFSMHKKANAKAPLVAGGQAKSPTSPPGLPLLEGILEVKSQSFRKFRPQSGWEVYVLVWIMREDKSVERYEMTQADFLKFQEARGVFTVMSEPKDAPE
jgi:hypothetical protein